MAERRRLRTRSAVAALLVVAGGALVAAGAVLPWLKSRLVEFREVVRVHDAATTTGLETTIGRVTLVAGIAAVVAGVMALASRPRRDRTAAGVLGLVASVGVLVLATFGTVTAKSQAIDDAVSTAFPPAKGTVSTVLHRLADIGAFRTSIQPGLMLVLIGGGLALAGSAATLAFASRRERSLMPDHEGDVPVPPPPHG